jgi:hypothetical protein
VVDGIDNTTAWCLWWRVCADRASPVCVVEEERKKEASESGSGSAQKSLSGGQPYALLFIGGLCLGVGARSTDQLFACSARNPTPPDPSDQIDRSEKRLCVLAGWAS